MLRIRILTALVGIPFLISVIYLGGLYWQGLVVMLTAAALMEFFVMMANKGFHPFIISSAWLAFILLFRVQLAPYLPGLFLAGLILMILSMVLSYPQRNINDLALSLFGAVYTGFLFSYALVLSTGEEAFFLLLLVFVLTWASDVGGYLCGRLWGKHKLAPQLSPGKTREGAAGAVILTILAALMYQHWISLDNSNTLFMVLMAVAASAAAQLGDLLESAIKRYFEVKDSGHLLPGHGGILDRFDSFLLVSPVIYYFLVVLKPYM